ncbi:MAG: hypothetical protein ACKOE2_09350 [Actinomycetales bacterium]
MFAGARLVTGGEETVTVWQASRDLPAGTLPVAQPVEVSLGAAASSYLLASRPLAGRLRVPVSAGALIPADALGPAPDANSRLVTLAINPLHAPVGLAAGDVVDVWATGVDAGNEITQEPTLVLPQARVVGVDMENLGIGGEVAVVIEIPDRLAVDVVRAARSRVLDLVAVPLAATSTLENSTLENSTPENSTAAASTGGQP